MAVSGQGIGRIRCRLEQADGVLKRQVAKSRPMPSGFGRDVHVALTHRIVGSVSFATPRSTVGGEM